MQLYSERSPLVSVAKHEYKYILSIMDCFSKYCWLVPLTHEMASCVSEALAYVFKEFGCPRILQSDNGGEFANALLRNLSKRLSIQMIHGRPYHPQLQGQVESLNKRVKKVLISYLVCYNPCDQVNIWPYLLPDIAHHLNNTWHFTIQDIPFKIFYGRDNGYLGCYKEKNRASGLLPPDKFLTCPPPKSPNCVESNECVTDELMEDDFHFLDEEVTNKLEDMHI